MATKRETIFERETSSEGGPLRLYEVPPIFQEFRMIYAMEGGRIRRDSQNRPGPLGPLKFLFPALVDNLSIDSVVFQIDGEHYVGLFAGGYLVLLDVFYTMLSHPMLLDDIGDASKEDFTDHIPTKGFETSLGHHEDLAAFIAERFFRNLPKDTERKKYAETMARIGFDFLFYHEIAHILAGHQELVDSSIAPINFRAACRQGLLSLIPRRFRRGGSHGFLKFKESIGLNFANRTSHIGRTDILEYDADRIAAKYILQFFANAVDMRDTSERGIKRLWDVFRAINFSIFTLFRLLAQDTPKVTEYRLSSHPHPDVRYILTSAVFREAAQNTSEETHIVVEGAMKRSFQDIWDAWAVLDLPNQFTLEKESFDEVCIDVIQRLDENQDLLSAYSHCQDITRWSTVQGRYV